MQAADHCLAPLCLRQESKQLVTRRCAISADGHGHKQLRDCACKPSTGTEGRIPSQECCNCCLSSAYQPRAVYLLLPTQSSGNMSLLIKTWAGLSFESIKYKTSVWLAWIEPQVLRDAKGVLRMKLVPKRYLKMLPFHQIQEKSKEVWTGKSLFIYGWI